MTTKCNIQINDIHTEIWMSNFWEGGPEVVGDELKSFIKHSMPVEAQQLANILNFACPDYKYRQQDDVDYLYQIYIGAFDIVMHTIRISDNKILKTDMFSRNL